MNHRIDRIQLSIALYFLVGLLCVASFIGCTGTNIIPTSKIDNAYGNSYYILEQSSRCDFV